MRGSDRNREKMKEDERDREREENHAYCGYNCRLILVCHFLSYANRRAQ